MKPSGETCGQADYQETVADAAKKREAGDDGGAAL